MVDGQDMQALNLLRCDSQNQNSTTSRNSHLDRHNPLLRAYSNSR